MQDTTSTASNRCPSSTDEAIALSANLNHTSDYKGGNLAHFANLEYKSDIRREYTITLDKVEPCQGNEGCETGDSYDTLKVCVV